MTLFSTIIAAANSHKALYDRSVFSYRGASFLNRLNQEWVSSTTHLRALNVVSFSISFFSSPRGRMWGIKPLSTATASFPVYPASRHKFCGCSPLFFGSSTRAFNRESNTTLSCRLAPVTTSDKGTPFSSTKILLLLPFFSPIRRVWPNRFLR